MLLTVGRVLRPHGVRGEVVVDVRTDEPEQRYAVGSELVAEPGDGVLRVAAQRLHQGRLIVSFDGIADRDAAESLRGTLLRVDSDALSPPEDADEFHDHQLVDLAVVTTAGEPVGRLARIEHAPGAELLVVARSDGGTALVPFVAALVPEVDLSAGRLVIDPPPGLLDL